MMVSKLLIGCRRIKLYLLNLLLIAVVLTSGGCSSSGKEQGSLEGVNSEFLPEEAPEGASEGNTKGTSEKGLETTPEVTPEKISGSAPEAASEETTETTPKATSGKREETTPEATFEGNTKGTPDKEPEETIDAVPEELPEGIAEAMSQGEILIDYICEGSILYALINSEGNLEYGDYFVIFTKEREGVWTRTYDNNFEQLKPWKIESGDIDGDSEKELLIAVIKSTPFDPEIKNRMFIFNMKNGVLVKKWTGSRIAGDWRDYYVGDLVRDIPGDELIFIEQLEEGQERISVYSWFDFGFFLLADSDELPLVNRLIISGDNSLQISPEDGQTRQLIMKGGKLTTTEEN